MKPAKSFIHLSNGALHDFTITYETRSAFGLKLIQHTVRDCKSLPNAVDRFDRAVPNHGAIKRVRKVEVR